MTARAAVGTMFFVNGAVIASWVPHIPAIKARHALGDGALGLALLCVAGGAVLALPLAGRLIEHFGSRAVTAAAAVGVCLAMPVPVLSSTVALLVVALFVLGACNGLLDVAMNAQAVIVESRYGRRILSSFHGLFSLGGLAGAVMAGVLTAAGLTAAAHTGLVGVAAMLAVVLARRALVRSASTAAVAPVLVRSGRAVLGLGCLAFAALLVEGAMADWSAVYLHDNLGTTPAMAAAGFAAFSLTMAAGRFGGDWLVNHFGPRDVVRACTAVAGAGMAVALLLRDPVAAVVGFGLVGFGIANAIPVLFSAAARVPGLSASTALAAVATTGYFGFLVGPPLIGAVAEVTRLPVALGIVSALCALIALFASVVGPRRAHGRVHTARIAAEGDRVQGTGRVIP
jgi:fucose permease